MEYEIEDRPQMGEDAAYEYLVTHSDWRAGVLPPRFISPDHSDRAVQIPEQEILS